MTRQKQGPLRYAAYLRCSTDDQKHGDYSTVQAQREINARHIENMGGLLVGDYNDEGRSGTNLNRAEWKRLLSDARAGAFDAVVVTYMSRLGRGEIFHVAEYLLKEAGVSMVLVQEQFSEDLNGYMNKSLKVFMDGMYPKQVSEWTKTKMEQMVTKGYRCGGTLPFGYTTVSISDPAFARPDKEPPKRLVINSEEAPFVQNAFSLFAESRSTERVRRYLNSVTPRSWSLDNVSYMLRNEVYRGILVFGKWRNEAAHEAIIDPVLWDAVQASKFVRAPKADPVDRTAFYLRGIVHCGHCGNRMTPANHHGRVSTVRYYECIANTKRKAACPVKRINAQALHSSVLDHIRRAAEHPTRMTEIIREAVKTVPVQDTLASQLAVIDKRVKENEKRTKAIMTAIEAGGTSLKPLLGRMEELQEQQQALQTERYKVAAQVSETRLARPEIGYVQGVWQRFLKMWDAATEEERNALLPLLVERVEMTEKERGFCRLSFLPANPRHSEGRPEGFVATIPKLGAGQSPYQELRSIAI